MTTIDGLTLEQVKYNIFAFRRDMKIFAGKRNRAKSAKMKAKWQQKYDNAKGYFKNNQERLTRFETAARSTSDGL